MSFAVQSGSSFFFFVSRHNGERHANVSDNKNYSNNSSIRSDQRFQDVKVIN